MSKKKAPKDETLRKVLSEIIDGYTKIKFNQKVIFVKHFCNEDQYLLEENYQQVYDSAKISFDERFQEVDWKKHYNSLPFNDSALALYKWAPIADELKTLDRKIVLNSMILK